MHIVSQVEGILEKGKTGIDALRATFPAGTVSGAPKIKAIEVIDALEPKSARFTQESSDTLNRGATSIRASRLGARSRGRLAHPQAGAGIVYDSVPEKNTGTRASSGRSATQSG